MTAPLFDLEHIESLLRDTARKGHAMSYSEVLNLLGMAFTRPKMRALCNVLDEIDRRAAAADEPELAVLVVRESDRLPGQGWWIGRTDFAERAQGRGGHDHVARLHKTAFDFWREESIQD